MLPFKISVNQEKYEVHGVDPATPLLWVLRDHLNLVGTKYGCGGNHCGACTVHLDGKAIPSCLFPISAVGTLPVTTIEGLAEDEEHLHPLQKAWIDQDVPQCGYCQAGQIMSAAALLEENPDPTDQDIDDAMSGNLCRCYTYKRIRNAIRSVAKERGGAR